MELGLVVAVAEEDDDDEAAVAAAAEDDEEEEWVDFFKNPARRRWWRSSGLAKCGSQSRAGILSLSKAMTLMEMSSHHITSFVAFR